MDKDRLIISEVPDAELPHRVQLILKDNAPTEGAGVTLASALMRVFSVSGLFPNKQFPSRTFQELARFIFWRFDDGENWRKAIEALSTDDGEQTNT